uniref:Uncharacterized protein n=1 Tax=Haptolina ericina TaxID=156174 RepID=A0A7S3EU59_9EUKA
MKAHVLTAEAGGSSLFRNRLGRKFATTRAKTRCGSNSYHPHPKTGPCRKGRPPGKCHRMEATMAVRGLLVEALVMAKAKADTAEHPQATQESVGRMAAVNACGP